MIGFQNNLEEVANEIVNHFFELGATIGKVDYDYVLHTLKNVQWRQEKTDNFVKAYEEITFDSLEEYETEYPKYIEAFKRVRKQIEDNKPPFENNLYSKQ